jgi:HEAT repeat protein
MVMKDAFEATDELVRMALVARHEDARWEIVNRLHWRGTREVFEAAREMCTSPHAFERTLGADVLAQLGLGKRPFRAETVPILLRLLDDQHPQVIYSAAIALGHNRDTSIVGPLSGLVHHPSKDVRFGVVFGLLSLEDPRAVEALIALSKDADPEVRDWATFGLGAEIALDTPPIRDALLARVRDADLETRADALLGLARRGDQRVVEPLLEALRSDVVGTTDVQAAVAAGAPKLYQALVELRAWWDVDPGLLESAIATCRPLS